MTEATETPWTRRLEIRTVPVAAARLPDLRIGVLGDLHTGAPFINEARLRRLVDEMNRQKPDLADVPRIRAPLMGRLIRTRVQAPLEMAGALRQGAHLGMLVDQHFSRGVDVTFFGRRCKANPALARLARQFECPVVGVRVVRLPAGRFRVDAVGPLDLQRDPDGAVDVPRTMQHVTDIVEAWVREHPDQWLWFHRRWR